MTSVELIHSPSEAYIGSITKSLATARSFTLITAFSTASGFQRVAEPLDRVLSRPQGQGRIVIALERQLFNTEPLFRTLLELQARHPKRLELSLVPERLGILHAKALHCISEDGANTLIIGSANLTSSAFDRNHELGLVLHHPERMLIDAFRRFVSSLSAQRLDASNAEPVLETLGLLRAKSTPLIHNQPKGPDHPSFNDVTALLFEPGTPLPVDEQQPMAKFGYWTDAGFLVGPGRSGTDALVLRLPMQRLEAQGLVALSRKRSLGGAARESRTLSYHVELLPTDVAEQVRIASRKISQLRSKLSLKLACFGHWMPSSYWSVFEQARSELQQDQALDPGKLFEAATLQKARLLEQGQLDADLAFIIDNMIRDGVLEIKKRAAAETYLRAELRRLLRTRSPQTMVNALRFRTARQRWAPYEHTETPFRQLMADIVQAVFASTLNTGRWPGRFPSVVARELADVIARTLREEVAERRDEVATAFLEQAQRWEDPAVPFREAFAEFARYVPLDHDFEAPELEALVGASEEEDG